MEVPKVHDCFNTHIWTPVPIEFRQACKAASLCFMITFLSLGPLSYGVVELCKQRREIQEDRRLHYSREARNCLLLGIALTFAGSVGTFSFNSLAARKFTQLTP